MLNMLARKLGVESYWKWQKKTDEQIGKDGIDKEPDYDDFFTSRDLTMIESALKEQLVFHINDYDPKVREGWRIGFAVALTKVQQLRHDGVTRDMWLRK